MPVIRQTKYEVLEPGTYRAKVGAIEVEDGQFGEQLKMRFDLLEEGLTDKSLMAWATAKLSPKSKLYQWTSVLLFGGRPLPDDFDLDTYALLDRETLILVDVQEKEGGTFNRVSQLLPLRRNGGKPGNGSKPTPAPVPAGRLADPATCPDCGALVAKPNSACASGRHPGPVAVNVAPVGGPGQPTEAPEWLPDEDGAQ